jgi:CIC family chloride channel protein
VREAGGARWPVLLGGAAVLGAVGVGAAWVLLHLVWAATWLAFWHRLGWRDAEASLAPGAGGLATLAALVLGAAAAAAGIRWGHASLAGHGIPEVMEAIRDREARIPPRVALCKPILSAVVIGTGSPFGAEGPIVQTGAALGSLLGQWWPVRGEERAAFVAAGAAAGMTGVFGTPLAAALLALELLGTGFARQRVASVLVTVAVAAALRRPVLGARPLFALAAGPALGLSTLPGALAYGVVAGLEGAGLTWALYALEGLYARWVRAAGWRPLVGAAAVGVLGRLDPRVLGVGYFWIRAVLAGRLGGASLARLAAAKAAAWLLALASGTVGGVLAPLFLVGGASGGFLAHLAPWAGLGPRAALVSMAAVFGAASGAPWTATVFAVEVTGDYAALPAVLTATALGAAVASRLLPYDIMTGKPVRRARRTVGEESRGAA